MVVLYDYVVPRYTMILPMAHRQLAHLGSLFGFDLVPSVVSLAIILQAVLDT